MSKPYAEVIGDPIAQSKSPVIHGYWLGQLGMAADYHRAHVRPGDLAAYLAQRRADPDWRGCNVTMPHKQAIIPLLDRLDPLAQQVGAVNTVVPMQGDLVGFNTDVSGFMEPLAGALPRHALVIGAGGAARAVLTGLVAAGAQITLAARDPAKAQALLDELAPGGTAAHLADFAQPGPARFDLVANTSPLGMVGNPPLLFDLSHSARLVYDIVTSPAVTPLLADARAAGHATVDGLAMLIGQAAEAFARFYGAPAPRLDQDRPLRALLTA